MGDRRSVVARGMRRGRRVWVEGLERRLMLSGNGTISGTVKILSSGVPMAGVTVFLDMNRNGVLDGGESSFVTGSDGKWTVTAPIGVEVQVQEVVPSGFEEWPPDLTTLSEISPLIGVVTGELIFNSPEKLAFQEEPSGGATGGVMKPVAVAIEKTDGTVDNSAKGNVTLTLSGGNGTLGGTVTEPVEDGVATFSDLTIDEAGDYTLTATTEGLTGSSHEFEVASGKLVFLTQPKNGNVNQALSPSVEVAVEDGKGKILTDEEGTTVTVAAIGVNGSHTSGNTATLSGGVATFSGLKVDTAGTYVLQASDGGDTDVSSARFVVAGEHLVWKGLPKTLNAGQAATKPVEVVVENNKNQVVKGNSDAIEVDFVGDAGNQTLSVTCVNGVGMVGAASLKLKEAGDYAVTATDVQYLADPSEANGPNPVGDAQGTVTVLGTHLVIKRLPGEVDARKAVSPAVQVALENSKNQVLTTTSDPIKLEFDAPSVSDVSFEVTSVKGVATFSGENAVNLELPGTYIVEATDEAFLSDPAANGENSVPTVQGSMKVDPLHVVIRRLPATIKANVAVMPAVQVVVENSKGQVVKGNSDPVSLIFETASVAEGTVFVGRCVNGVATLTGGAQQAVRLTVAGEYTVTAADEAFLADPAVSENPVLEATATVTVV